MAELGVLAQTLDAPLSRLEAGTVSLSGTFSSSPAAWTTSFRVWRDPGDTPAAVDPGAPAVTGAYAATWTVAIPLATAAALKPGLNTFVLLRTDAGSEEVLCRGCVLVLDR